MHLILCFSFFKFQGLIITAAGSIKVRSSNVLFYEVAFLVMANALSQLLENEITDGSCYFCLYTYSCGKLAILLFLEH